MDRLIVKNFGPLKDVDIELNKINLFIGENGSGKSILAKIITIVLDITKIRKDNINKKFRDYNINFFSKNSTIQLISYDKVVIELKYKKIIIEHEFEVNPFKDIDIDKEKLKKLMDILSIKDEKVLNFVASVPEGFNRMYDFMSSQYIPAERSFVSLISKSLSSFIVADIPLPKFFLQFSSEFEKAGNELKELELLNVKYVNGDGLDRHKVYFNDKDYLLLNESSSGIQSALPLYLTVKYFSQKHSSIIIEEPEQNLFPKAQKETIEYVIENISYSNSLYMMTHSPYVLTALNNLILANDVKNQKGVEAIKGIVKEEQCVAFEEVSAYSLVDGNSISIMDREERLIGVNLIDSISDEVSDTFDRLLEQLD